MIFHVGERKLTDMSKEEKQLGIYMKVKKLVVAETLKRLMVNVILHKSKSSV